MTATTGPPPVLNPSSQMGVRKLIQAGVYAGLELIGAIICVTLTLWSTLMRRCAWWLESEFLCMNPWRALFSLFSTDVMTLLSSTRYQLPHEPTHFVPFCRSITNKPFVLSCANHKNVSSSYLYFLTSGLTFALCQLLCAGAFFVQFRHRDTQLRKSHTKIFCISDDLCWVMFF
jgi:hypothetical protein